MSNQIKSLGSNRFMHHHRPPGGGSAAAAAPSAVADAFGGDSDEEDYLSDKFLAGSSAVVTGGKVCATVKLSI